MPQQAPVHGRPRRGFTKSVETRGRILDAAATVLSERGYAAFRITDVADLADLQAPAIYYHFASRDELVEEVIANGQRSVMEHVSSALDTAPSPVDRLPIAVAAHLEFILTSSAYASASIRNFSQLPDAMRSRQLVLRRKYGTLWRNVFGDLATTGCLDPRLDVPAVRMFTLGALNWVAEWWDPSRGTVAELVAMASRFVVDAVRPRPHATDLPPRTTSAPTAGADGSHNRKAVRTRRRILDAAARVLCTRGYAGTRLSDIADLADMQAASLYYHFGSREDLIEVVVRTGVQQVAAQVTNAVAALPSDTSPLDRLDRAVEAHLESCLREPDFAVAAIRNTGQLPPAMAARQHAAESEYADTWRGILDDAARAESLAPGLDLSATRMLILGALNQAGEWSDTSRGTTAVVRTARVMVRNAVSRDIGSNDGCTGLAPVLRPPRS